MVAASMPHFAHADISRRFGIIAVGEEETEQKTGDTKGVH
jgi:hypothetical protein